MSFLDAILASLVVLFAISMRPLSDKEKGFNRDTTATLRGLAMLGIILHHIHNRFGIYSPILSQVGYLTTGMFFFISGYGNMLSINKRIEVKADWLIKKIIKIYVPFFVAYWIYYIMLIILYNTKVPSIVEMITDIFTVSLPNQVSWFPKIILLCFLVHWIAKKVTSNVLIQNILLLCFILLYIIIMWKIGQEIYWYNSVLCYPMGCIIAKPTIFSKLLDWLKNCKVLSFILFFVAFIIVFIATQKTWLLTFICALLFSATCYYFSFIFKTRTKVFSWIGNNSFEFYVFHIVCLQMFCNIIVVNKYLYTGLVIIGSFVLVFIYLNIKRKFFSKKNI